MVKAIALNWLAKTDLSNLNAGEGAGNITELKLYGNGKKPYVSGQAIRRALFDTLQRHYQEHFLCTAERPCQNVEHCWGCDLRGFLATEEGKSGKRRWSPIKVSPALGQIANEIVSDLLTRHSDENDQRLAHVQMMENIYKVNLIIDVENVGRVVEPIIEKNKKKDKGTFKGYQTTLDLEPEKRLERVSAILDAVYHLSGLAKQARAVSSLAPEILFVTVKTTYNQRGLHYLDLDQNRKMHVERLTVGLNEHQLLGDQLCVGWTPGIVRNETEVQQVLQAQGIPMMSVLEAIKWAKSQLRDHL